MNVISIKWIWFQKSKPGFEPTPHFFAECFQVPLAQLLFHIVFAVTCLESAIESLWTMSIVNFDIVLHFEYFAINATFHTFAPLRRLPFGQRAQLGPYPDLQLLQSLAAFVLLLQSHFFIITYYDTTKLQFKRQLRSFQPPERNSGQSGVESGEDGWNWQGAAEIFHRAKSSGSFCGYNHTQKGKGRLLCWCQCEGSPKWRWENDTLSIFQRTASRKRIKFI